MARGFKERRQKPYAGRAPAKKFLGAGTPQAAPPAFSRAWVTLGPGGRFVIPKKLRQAMEVEVGERLSMEVVDGELRAHGLKVGWRKAQEIVARHVPPHVSLVDDLLRERRREVEMEERELAESRKRRRSNPSRG
jgi:bifunctional DNA-binding transcriptional regulator/antitoxin component of YhaV-PrlF toxin-antitoxin module